MMLVLDKSMRDFTDRERKIIVTMLTVINPLSEVRNQPQDVKEQLIKEALRIRQLQFNEKEIVEIINGITEESQDTIKHIYGFLQAKNIDWRALDFKSILKGRK